MSTLLYVKASPRGQRSKSLAVADAVVAAHQAAAEGVTVDTLDLFEAELPTFDGLVLEAKYAILHGQPPSPEQSEAWKTVETVIERFTAADRYVIASPMWNFGVPYRLKHYFDVLVQPTYTFAVGPDGYEGLVTGKPAVVVSARGGEYLPSEASGADHEKPYIELILGFMGFTDIRHVVVEPTLASGPQVGQQRLQTALEDARKVGASL